MSETTTFAHHIGVEHVPNVITRVSAISCFVTKPDIHSETLVTLWEDSDTECVCTLDDKKDSIEAAEFIHAVINESNKHCLLVWPSSTTGTSTVDKLAELHKIDIRSYGSMSIESDGEAVYSVDEVTHTRTNGADYRESARRVMGAIGYTGEECALHVRAMMHLVVWSLVSDHDVSLPLSNIPFDYGDFAHFARCLAVAIVISAGRVLSTDETLIPWIVDCVFQSIQNEEAISLYIDITELFKVKSETLAALALRVNRTSVFLHLLDITKKYENVHVVVGESLASGLRADVRTFPMFRERVSFHCGFSGSVFVQDSWPSGTVHPMCAWGEGETGDAVEKFKETDFIEKSQDVVVFDLMRLLVSYGVGCVGHVRDHTNGLWLSDRSPSAPIIHITSDARRVRLLYKLWAVNGSRDFIYFPTFYQFFEYAGIPCAAFVYTAVDTECEIDDDMLNDCRRRAAESGLQLTRGIDKDWCVVVDGRALIILYQKLVTSADPMATD